MKQQCVVSNRLPADIAARILHAVEDDPRAFASALRHLLESPQELLRMGAEGRVTATTRYAWRGVAAELEAHYLELRGEGTPGLEPHATAARATEAPAPV